MICEKGIDCCERGVVVWEGLLEWLVKGLVHDEGLESLFKSNSNCWSAEPVVWLVGGWISTFLGMYLVSFINSKVDNKR